MSSAVYRSSPAVDVNSFSRHSNNAGSPLPFIPRRRSSMPSSQAIFPFPQPDPVVPSTNNQSQKSSSQNTDGKGDDPDPSESRGSGMAQIQHKIQPLLPLQPVGPSSVSTLEFPRQSPLMTASDGVQTLPSSQSIPALTHGDPALTPGSAAILSASPSVEGRIRKKSGEPVKPSLKPRPPTPRPSLSVVTGLPSSKSEPATPNHARSKSVSFAERLDHVKLFFAEQKPIAVSRDGSPTEDTSGTESEAPAPVRRISPDDEKKRLLVMEVVNMPQRSTMDVAVMLEDITLSKEATICGHVKVRNLAFQKSVAVRFTFDSWQTTSEVTAKYEQSLAHGVFDRFSFVIRLHDILSKIEEKTLFMAIRYAVNGRELWDNNGGLDYKITFSLPATLRAPGTIAQIQYASDEEAVANLTQKLERVQSTEALKDVQRFHRRGSGSTEEDFFFNSSASLSSRYTWGASLKKPWKPVDHSAPPHSRPTVQPASGSIFPWSHKPGFPPSHQRSRAIRVQGATLTHGSPRLGGDSVASAITIQGRSPGDLHSESDPVWRSSFRNHTRSGYTVRQPSGLSDTVPQDGRVTKAMFDFVSPRDKTVDSADADHGRDPGSIPIVQAPMFRVGGQMERIPSDDSSITSSTSSSSQPSPVVIATPTPGPPSNEMASIINRFCFYTSSGTEPGMVVGPTSDGGVLGVGANATGGTKGLAADTVGVAVSEDTLQRSYSTSSIEDILHQSQRFISPIEYPESPLKSRSSSCDDLVSFSGSPTPTLTPTKTHHKL